MTSGSSSSLEPLTKSTGVPAGASDISSSADVSVSPRSSRDRASRDPPPEWQANQNGPPPAGFSAALGTTQAHHTRSTSVGGPQKVAHLLGRSTFSGEDSHSSITSSGPASVSRLPMSTPSSPANNHKLPLHARVSTTSVFQALSDASKLRFSITSSVPVHSATEKEFTAFLVTIISPAEEDTEPRTILRRYRQFSALNASVVKNYDNADLPHFPKKRLIGNMSQQLVEKRRRKLEIWLQHVSRLPGIEDMLGFITFLGGDMPQRGVKKKTGSQSTSSPNGQGSANLGVGGANSLSGSAEMMDDSYKETEKEKEQRVAAERRYNEVKYFVSRLDSCIYKLEGVEAAFENVYETTDFVVHSEYSKLVVILGKYLGNRPLSNDFVPRELSKEKEDKISNVKIRSIRQKIIPAISELVSKLRDIKDCLLDVTFPMDQVLELTHIIDDVQDIFDESNLVPKALGFRMEAGATHYEALREKWSDYIESNIYHYKEQFVGTDHIIAYNGERVEGSICVALQPLAFSDENHGEFRLFICSRDGNDFITTKAQLTKISSEWKDKFADILTSADSRLRGIEWTTCTPAEAEPFILEHEKRDMRITRKLKFGILLCLKDQEKEEEMFGNFTSTPAFEHFLDGMGERVQLTGYQGFAGGLDTRGSNSTGTHSYVHNWPGLGNSGPFQLMYHVSTLLPHGEADQNLAKKRHIGNDIVAIVFQEDGSKPFLATTIKSNYLQIIIVVRSINLGDGKYAWRVTVSNAQDVPEYGPPLPYPPIFTDRSILCDWLVHKMINGELAAYRGKLFIQQFRTTWKTLVSDLVSKLPPSKRKGSKPTKEKVPKKK